MSRQNLTELNLRCIETIARFRVMTTEQLHRAVFLKRERSATENSVANVMRRLHERGFVARDWLTLLSPERGVYDKPRAVWFVAPPNFAAIRAELARTERAHRFEELRPLARQASDTKAFAMNTLRHEIAITEFYLALERAEAGAGQVPFWLRTSPRHPEVSTTVRARKKITSGRQEGRSLEVDLPLNPDGLHAIRNDRGTAFFFLEIDMNTETGLEKLSDKFLAYYVYFDRDRFGRELAPMLCERHKIGVSDPSRARFRVLFVTTNAKRRNDLLLKSRVLPTSNVFQFATLSEVAQDPFGAVWLSKKDFEPYLDEYNRRTHTDPPALLREWGHGILDQLEKHAL